MFPILYLHFFFIFEISSTPSNYRQNCYFDPLIFLNKLERGDFINKSCNNDHIITHEIQTRYIKVTKSNSNHGKIEHNSNKSYREFRNLSTRLCNLLQLQFANHKPN